MVETRERLLEVALEVLGENADAGVGEIAAAAGVVRRTVYGHFPSRNELVLSLARRAAEKLHLLASEAVASEGPADAAWAGFVAEVWPLTRRYRALVALRRGELGAEIHALLAPMDAALADLVRRGQVDRVFARHLPEAVLSQIAYAAIFSVADNARAVGAVDARAATVASLLTLGVPERRAISLARGERHADPTTLGSPTDRGSGPSR
jgi:AcrR family transcriptional regulator